MREVKAVYVDRDYRGVGVVVWTEDEGQVLDEMFFAEMRPGGFRLPSGGWATRLGLVEWADEHLA